MNEPNYSLEGLREQAKLGAYRVPGFIVYCGPCFEARGATESVIVDDYYDYGPGKSYGGIHIVCLGCGRHTNIIARGVRVDCIDYYIGNKEEIK